MTILGASSNITLAQIGGPAAAGQEIAVALNATHLDILGGPPASLAIKGGAVSDGAGNQIGEVTVLIISQDTTPPHVSSASFQPDAGLLEMVFTEAIDHTATNHDAVTILGESANLTLAETEWLPLWETLTVVLNRTNLQEMGAPRHVSFPSGSVTDAAGNPIATVTVPVTTPDTVPPEVTSVTYHDPTGRLTVTFSEPLDHTATNYDAMTILGASSNITLAQIGGPAAAGQEIAVALNATHLDILGGPPASLAIKGGAVSDGAGNPAQAGTHPVATTNTPSTNRPPSADAGADRLVQPGDIVILNGTASTDPDGDPLTYLWNQTSGDPVTLSAAASPYPNFTAPDYPTTMSFELVVRDGSLSSVDTASVVVSDPAPTTNSTHLVATTNTTSANRPPSADAGADRLVQPGDIVILNGTASDQDGDHLTYRWSHDSALNITLADTATTLSPSFTAPQVDSNTTITFTLTATDTHNATSSDQMTVTITDMPANNPPVVDAGADRIVVEGEPLTLNGTASDQDGDHLTYRWSHDSALNITLADTATTLSPSFTAPQVDSNTTITFTLTATDTHNATSSDQMAVTITDMPANNPPVVIAATGPADQAPNRAPVAEIGLDLTAWPGQTVTLNGTASADPDGDPLTYLWSQVSGEAVALSGNTSSSATFTAPDRPGGSLLVFRLSVSDGLLSSTDTVSVVVSDPTPVTNATDLADQAPNRAPVAEIGLDLTAWPGQTVTLNGTASADPDGDPLTYLWSQVSGEAVALSGNTSSSATFTAPDRPGGSLLVFRLSVSDGLLSSTDTVSVVVSDPTPVTNSTAPVTESQPTTNSTAPATESQPTTNSTAPATNSTAPVTGTESQPTTPATNSTAPVTESQPTTPATNSTAPVTESQPTAPATNSTAPVTESQPTTPATNSTAPVTESQPTTNSTAPVTESQPTTNSTAPDPEPRDEPPQDDPESEEPQPDPQAGLPEVVKRYDTNRNGIIDQQEWEKAIEDYANYLLNNEEILAIASARS